MFWSRRERCIQGLVDAVVVSVSGTTSWTGWFHFLRDKGAPILNLKMVAAAAAIIAWIWILLLRREMVCWEESGTIWNLTKRNMSDDNVRRLFLGHERYCMRPPGSTQPTRTNCNSSVLKRFPWNRHEKSIAFLFYSTLLYSTQARN